MTHTEQVYSQINTDLFGQHCVSFKGGVAYFHSEVEAVKAIFYDQVAALLIPVEAFVRWHNSGNSNPNSCLQYFRPTAAALRKLDDAITHSKITANETIKMIDNELCIALSKIEINRLHRHQFDRLKDLNKRLVEFTMRWSSFTLRQTQKTA